MKRTFYKIGLTILIVGLAQAITAQNVAINADGAAPDASAMLDVKSTTRGLLTPRMTAAQRVAISSPATGLIVYQTDGTAGYYYYDGGWVMLMNTDASNLASGTVPTARLGSGTADNTTFLRGDGTWASPTAALADQSVYGTKFKSRTVTTNTTLTTSDFLVIMDGNITITLPASPNDGDILWIAATSMTGSINTNGIGIILSNSNWLPGTYTILSDFGSITNTLLYSATENKWILINNL